jgi:hypothetical protein
MKWKEQPVVDEASWISLAEESLPQTVEFLGDVDRSGSDICMEIACLADRAHREGDRELAAKCYDFMRWSIRHTIEEVRGNIANSFFTEVLRSGSAKTACLDFLDWGDVKLFIGAWTVEPFFDDVENFDRLCGTWKKRWSRHGKLPEPPDPRTALWRNVPEDPQD